MTHLWPCNRTQRIGNHLSGVFNTNHFRVVSSVTAARVLLKYSAIVVIIPGTFSRILQNIFDRGDCS